MGELTLRLYALLNFLLQISQMIGSCAFLIFILIGGCGELGSKMLCLPAVDVIKSRPLSTLAGIGLGFGTPRLLLGPVPTGK